MPVYIIGTVLSVLFAGCYSLTVSDEKLHGIRKVLLRKSFAFVSVIPLAFIMAVRRNVGTDYNLYWNWIFGTRESLEGGFKLLNSFADKIFHDRQGIFIICSVITCGLYYSAIYKESINPAYSVLLFVITKDYFAAMNGMRQYLACALALYSIHYIKRDQRLKALIVILFAAWFHRSVIVFILAYVLYYFPLRPLVASIVFACGFLLSGQILRLIFPILDRFQFYTHYFAAVSAYNNVTGDTNFRYILIFLCFFILLAYEYKKVINDKNLKLLYASVELSLFILSVGAILPLNAQRVTWYFNAFIILYIPQATKMLDSKMLRVLVNISIILLYTVIAISDTLRGVHDVLPYRTIWS